jgi:prepilin peptidase CpaA
MIFITLWALMVLIGLLLYCAVSDFRRLKIPNVIVLVMIGCFFLAFVSTPQIFFPLWQHVLAMLGMFFVTYVMFAKNLMGGGDAKMMTAVSLWLGLKGLLSFVFYMGLAGGVLGLAALWLQKKKPVASPAPGSWIESVQSGKNTVPYGIAIAIGALGALSYLDFPHHIVDEINKIISS